MQNTFDIAADAKAKQRAAVLGALKSGPLSTIAAREQLGIAHPAGRVLELRKGGHAIKTITRTVPDLQGRNHRSAVYVLATDAVGVQQ